MQLISGRVSNSIWLESFLSVSFEIHWAISRGKWQKLYCNRISHTGGQKDGAAVECLPDRKLTGSRHKFDSWHSSLILDMVSNKDSYSILESLSITLFLPVSIQGFSWDTCSHRTGWSIFVSCSWKCIHLWKWHFKSHQKIPFS